MGIPVSDRKCNFCDKDLGNEFHYLLNCQYFKDKRKKHIKSYFYIRPNN